MEDTFKEYMALAVKVRKRVLEMVYKTQSPHIGPSFSATELLVSLYFRKEARFTRDLNNPNRDRFILSKGHACPALYAVLLEKGFIEEGGLERFAVSDGIFEQHPCRDTSRGIELTTGSLGHGLSVATGMAIALRRDGKDYRVYALLGDGELNEGSSWEAAMFASHHRLDKLVAIVDYNKMQALGYTRDIINLEPLSQKWSSFGWAAREVDGHDFGQILGCLGSLPFSKGQPSVIIAHTIKGKGVSFMEDKLLWHYRAPSKEEYEMALRELSQ